MDGLDVRRDKSSGFLLGETDETAEEAEAGMEKPTTEEVGRELGFEGDAASLRKRAAHDCFGAAGLAGAGAAGGSLVTGCSVGAGMSG